MRRRLIRFFQMFALAAAAIAAGGGFIELGLAMRGRAPGWTGYASGWAHDDMEARYRLTPGVYRLFDCDARINSLGARGPEPARPVQVLNLGDSCTFGVGVEERKTYPALLTARGFEAVNAGVPGYNTFSGRRQLEESGLLGLRPRFVTIYFGWNDHWRAIATESAFRRLRGLARYSRAASTLLTLQSKTWSDDPRTHWFSQVPLSDFKENLAAMIAESRRFGAEVILITAPSERRFARNVRRKLRAEYDDHERYAAAVREVAVLTGTELLDLKDEIAKRRTADPGDYFIDYAHLNAKGHRLLADLLIERLRRRKTALD